MLVFLDTEFTDFINTEMLSIGMVTADAKHEFYAERTDYSLKMCSGFVREEILPLFDKSGFVGTKEEIGLKIVDWIIRLPYSDVIIVIDYHGDWQVLGDVLPSVPMKLKRSPEYIQGMTDFATNVSIQGVEEYFEKIDKRRHHALVDAKANRHGWLAAMKTLY
jgi:hypothetical protein